MGIFLQCEEVLATAEFVRDFGRFWAVTVDLALDPEKPEDFDLGMIRFGKRKLALALEYYEAFPPLQERARAFAAVKVREAKAELAGGAR